MYKILALDLDGTLLNSKDKISNEDFEAVQQAYKSGVHIIISSARPFRSIKHIIQQLNLEDTYVIALAGTDVRKYPEGDVIWRASLTAEQVRKAKRFSDENGQFVQVFRVDGDYYFEESCGFSDQYAQYFGYAGNQADLMNWEYKDAGKAMILTKVEDAAKIYEKAKNDLEGQFNVVKSWHNMIELYSLTANKGAALESVAKYLNVLPDEIIAVGDELVDIPLLKYAGVGVAMGNSNEGLKAIADYITLDNDNNGVAQAIKKYILK